jgi:NarL family two-component system response regulator LiaR
MTLRVVISDEDETPGTVPIPASATQAVLQIAGGLVALLQALSRAESRAQEDESPHLSNREREVLVLIGQGLSNQQIADQLYLSIYTVKGHVSSILRKLRVLNRAEAALLSHLHQIEKNPLYLWKGLL